MVVKGNTKVEVKIDAGVLATFDANGMTPGAAMAAALLDTNGNEVVKLGTTASAVNEVTITNAATGSAPSIASSGGDTNIGLTVAGKGSGTLTLGQATGAISLLVNPTVAASQTLAVTTADNLTVGGIIVPQHIEVAMQIPKIAADTVYNAFIALRGYTVTGVSYVPTIAQGGAMTVTPVKATSTSAPSAGTTPLLTAAFDGNATAHTVQNGTLTATGADLILAAGDRLGVVLSTASTVGQGLIVFSLKRS